MKSFLPLSALVAAVFFGTVSNYYANLSNGFTKGLSSLISALSIIACMYCLSICMKTLDIGVTYASFAGLCIALTTFTGFVLLGQVPNLYTILGLGFIVTGVLFVNLFGNS
jgi:small multidrug resistance pump